MTAGASPRKKEKGGAGRWRPPSSVGLAYSRSLSLTVAVRVHLLNHGLQLGLRRVLAETCVVWCQGREGVRRL